MNALPLKGAVTRPTLAARLIERTSELISACAGIGIKVGAFENTLWHPHTFGMVFWPWARTDLTSMFEVSAGYVARAASDPILLPCREG